VGGTSPADGYGTKCLVLEDNPLWSNLTQLWILVQLAEKSVRSEIKNGTGGYFVVYS